MKFSETIFQESANEFVSAKSGQKIWWGKGEEEKRYNQV